MSLKELERMRELERFHSHHHAHIHHEFPPHPIDWGSAGSDLLSDTLTGGLVIGGIALLALGISYLLSED